MAENLVAIAREHGLKLTPDGLTVDTTGADFLVLHAEDDQGGAWMVRFPRRADVMVRARLERKALQLVRSRLSVQVPEWLIFSEEMIAYPRLDGEPAAIVDLDAGGYVWRFDQTAPPQLFLSSLADTLRALHGIPITDADGAGLPFQSPSQVRETYAAQMEQAREVVEVPEAVWRRWQAWLSEESYWPASSVVVHGDLHPPHLLLDEVYRVVGLLDWTEAHVGDAATDFALLYATLGSEALAALLKRYRAGGGHVWPRMQEHIVEMWSAYPVVIASFARLSGEEAPRQLAQSLVEATAAEMASRSTEGGS